MLCSLFIGGAMVSCAEDYMETDKGHDTLTLTVNQQEIVLNEKNHSQEALTLSWTTGTNYGSGNRISYTLEIAKAGTDFARAYSVDLGTGTYQWTKKTEELNQFLNTQLGVGYAEKVSLEARITATVAGMEEKEQRAAVQEENGYKVGDDVMVDLPTGTIEGTIGYIGETDVRIDTSAHGQSWDNEVINKRQFEDGLRQNEPSQRVDEMLAQAEAQVPDKIAFKYKNGEKDENDEPVIVSVTYSEFINTTRAIGTALYERGFHGGAHVACIGENSYNWICVFLSTLAGDNVFVPIDKELPLAEMLNVLRRSGSSVVFCTEKYEKIINENKEQLPDIKLTVRTDNSEFTDLIAQGDAALKNGCKGYLESRTPENELKYLVYTSGTTGTSKGVMLSEKNIISCVISGLQVQTIYDVGLSLLPKQCAHYLYHCITIQQYALMTV